MSSRARAVLRALAPLSLTLLLVGCSLAFCGDDAFLREAALRHGEIAGTALQPGAAPRPAAFVQASVNGTPFVRRTNSEGRFLFSGLQEGPWMVTINEDLDGDGRPERRRVVSAVLRHTPHRTSPSYVPFAGGEGQTLLAGVDVGEVLLEGVVRVEGEVLLDGAGGPLSPVDRGRVAVVVAGRHLDLPRLESDGTDLVSLGAEVKTGVDDQGRFVLRNVSGGEAYLMVLVYELGSFPGAPGALVQVSEPVPVEARGEKLVLPQPIVLSADLGVPRRPAQLVFSPPPAPSEEVYLTLVPPGLEMPPCESAPMDYSATPFPYALTTSQIPAGASPQFSDVPVGLWDMQACFTSSPRGVLFAQPVVPETPNEPPVLLGPVLLSDLDQCAPARPCEVDADCGGNGFTCDEAAGRCEAPPGWRDCDGDGVRGLPPITNDDEAALWAACVSQCYPGPGLPVGDRTCDAPDGNTYDCDDDGDGQADVTEAQECYGVGRGTDSDGDGICDGVDPFPECRANTAEECEAGAEPDMPTVPEAYGGGEGGDGGDSEQCLVERAPEWETWCDASAIDSGGETCAVLSMTCSLGDGADGDPPRCDPLSGLGCPSDMACLADLAVGGVAPCHDLDAGQCDTPGEPCGRPGFVCTAVGGENQCVSELPEEPDVFRPYSCECCRSEGDCWPGPQGIERFWSPTICTEDEMQGLWVRCHETPGGGTRPDAGPDPDGGGDPVACVDVELDLATGSFLPAGVRCGRLVDGALTIVDQPDLSTLDFGDLQELEGDLVIQANPVLEEINASELRVLRGSLTLDSNPALGRLSVPSLQAVEGDLAIWRNPLLDVDPSLASQVSVSGERRVSVNGCETAETCTVFGTPQCAILFDPLNPSETLFGEVAVCYECQVDSHCTPLVCDATYTGPGTGTHTCIPGSVAP